MKKTILLVGSLSLLVIGVVTTSCNKDKFNGCVCTYPASMGGMTQEFPPEAVKELGLKDCAGLQNSLNPGGFNLGIVCKNK